MHNNENRWPYIALVLFSFVFGSYLFFLNPALSSAFDVSDKNIEWYAVFSKNIAHPTTTYIAESILLPLSAKILGASVSSQSYRFLCGLLTISLLPFLAILTHRFFNSTAKAFLFVLIFGISFTYLSHYRLGFPDPLTIAFLSFTALQRRALGIYLGSLLAGLSHFSMSVFALSALALLWSCSPTSARALRIQSLKFIALGLISSRVLLSLWFYVFEYKLISRADVVLDGGLTLFINHYNQSPWEFWLTPGLLFLMSYLAIAGYFALQRKTLFVVALFMALGLAYTAHFFTVDGLRVFAVVISSAYVFMLAACIDLATARIDLVLNRVGAYATRAIRFFDAHALRIGLGFPIIAAWLFFIGLATNKGFFINELPLIHTRLLGVRFLDYVLVSFSAIVLLAFTVPKLRTVPHLTDAAKIIFVFPLLIIGIQYLRHLVGESTYFPLWIKVLSLCVALGLAWLSTKIKLDTIEDRARMSIAALKKRPR